MNSDRDDSSWEEKGQEKSLKLQSSKDLLELLKFIKVTSFLKLRWKITFLEVVEILRNKKETFSIVSCHFIIHIQVTIIPPHTHTPCTQRLWKLYFDFSDLGGDLPSPFSFIDLLTFSYVLWFSSVPCFCTSLWHNQYLETFFRIANTGATFGYRIPPRGHHVRDLDIMNGFR